MMPAVRRTVHQFTLAMKFAPVPLVTALGLWCLVEPSCNPADPSAIQENQKALAETMAKNMRLNDEIAALKSQLEQAKTDVEKAKTDVEKAKGDRDMALAKPAKAEEPKMPSAAEVEARLDQEVAKLKDEARQKNPGAKVEGLSTWDVTSPGDNPYSCKAKVALTDAKGSRQTLYWTGSANLKGEWQFRQAENLEAKLAEPPPSVQPTEPPKTVAKNEEKKEQPKEDKKPEDKKPDTDNGFKPPILTVVKDGDKRGLKDQQKQPDRSQQQTTPDKPKQKFDIDLKNPVMGPGSK